MAKLGARLIRAVFVGNLVGMILFIVFFIGGVVINAIANQPTPGVPINTSSQPVIVIAPWVWGLVGWVIGISAGIGIELSKDLENQEKKQ